MSLSVQFATMLTMIGMGGFFGASMDTYTRLFIRKKRPRWIVFLHDVLFWIFQGLLIFYVLFLVNEGEVRIYVFLALLCGFAAYQSLLKSIYLFTLERTIRLIVNAYRLGIRIGQTVIIRPVQAIIVALLSFVLMIGRGLYTLVLFVAKFIIGFVKVLLSPFWKLLLWMIPHSFQDKTKKFFLQFAGFFRSVKNTLYTKVWKRIFQRKE
ncbi:spore cortex biosynthesis protein YabQ [Bacillus fonticola]|uniref:spore cortex biosynthesis protein YabQ n=1 Tax=Bacillus fonticola TaxID=2728853 RepID=UPI0014748AB3|nr:spore cortex biosynthesis protein YabQ [Bacillus fonticola]